MQVLLLEKLCRRVNVDTTAQEKAITFPTDAKLYDKQTRDRASVRGH